MILGSKKLQKLKFNYKKKQKKYTSGSMLEEAENRGWKSRQEYAKMQQITGIPQ